MDVLLLSEVVFKHLCLIMKKIIRITTVPISLKNLLKGQHRFMSNHYTVIGVSSPGDALQEVSVDEGISVIEVPMTRTISPLKDLQSLYRLYKVLKREKPFIVHSHTPKAGTIGMLAAKLAGIPNRFHTIAGLPLLEAKGPKRLLLDIVETITYACATKIYPNSFGLKEIILKNRYTRKSKLKVIGNGSSNGIDTDFFSKESIDKNKVESLKKTLGLSADDLVFIFVGRLVADKGINELVTAFKKLSSDIPNVKLLLVGSLEAKLDPLKAETISEIESNKHIISVGWQTDVRPYFAASDVLAFPSYREGFPNVVMQAGAMNLASIVTNINGCNEIISNNINGLIIPSKDETALLIAMLELAVNKEKRLQIAAVSRDHICKNYKRDIIWNALLKEYKDLE